MSERPLARIQLPSHHPHISAVKKGGKLTANLVADDTEDDVQPMGGAKPMAPRPQSLTRSFHVMSVNPPQMGREPSEDQRDAVKYVGKKLGGRKVT